MTKLDDKQSWIIPHLQDKIYSTRKVLLGYLSTRSFQRRLGTANYIPEQHIGPTCLVAGATGISISTAKTVSSDRYQLSKVGDIRIYLFRFTVFVLITRRIRRKEQAMTKLNDSKSAARFWTCNLKAALKYLME